MVRIPLKNLIFAAIIVNKKLSFFIK